MVGKRKANISSIWQPKQGLLAGDKGGESSIHYAGKILRQKLLFYTRHTKKNNHHTSLTSEDKYCAATFSACCASREAITRCSLSMTLTSTLAFLGLLRQHFQPKKKHKTHKTTFSAKKPIKLTKRDQHCIRPNN